MRQIDEEVRRAEVGRAPALREQAAVEQPATGDEADDRVEAVEDADGDQVEGDPGRRPHGHDDAREPREEMDDVVDGINPEDTEEPALRVGGPRRVRDEEDADEPRGVHPCPPLEHEIL